MKSNWKKGNARANFKLQLEQQRYCCARCGQPFGQIYNATGVIPGKIKKIKKKDGWLVCSEHK